MKNKVLVISGAQETGKSFLIERIIRDGKSLVIHGRDDSVMKDQFLLSEFTEGETKCIFFDSVRSVEVLKWIVMYCVHDMIVNRRGRKPVIVMRSSVEIIVETELTIEQIKECSTPSFWRRMDVVELASCSMKQDKAQSIPDGPPNEFAPGGFLIPPVIQFSSWYAQEKDHHISDAMDSFAFRFHNAIRGRSFQEILNEIMEKQERAAQENKKQDIEKLKINESSEAIKRLIEALGKDGIASEAAARLFSIRLGSPGAFIQWADVYFDPSGIFLDSLFCKSKAYHDFLWHNKRSPISKKQFENHLRFYVERKGWVFNPKEFCGQDGRIIRKTKRSSYNYSTNAWTEMPASRLASEFFYIQTVKK